MDYKRTSCYLLLWCEATDSHWLSSDGALCERCSVACDRLSGRERADWQGLSDGLLRK
jgi:hypothetical protein